MIDHHKVKFNQYCRLVGRLALKKDLFFNASAITFNLFICAIPFTLILISIIGYVLSFDAAFEEVLRYGRELFPNFAVQTQSSDLLAGYITLEALLEPLVEARRIFGIAGILILMIFAQGLFHTLKHVVFDVFDVQDRRHPVLELVHNFFAFGVVGGVFLFFTMAITLLSLYPLDSIVIPATDVVIELGWVTELLAGLVPLVFTPILFYVIFRYISERRINPRVAMLAALSYTVLFELAKFGVSVYLEYALTAYRYFYQGYTLLIIILAWVFYAAALFVFTAVMARAYQDVYDADRPAIDRNPYTAIS